MAKKNELDPVVGRDEEIERTLDVEIVDYH